MPGRMVKIGKDSPPITVGGEPLADHLEKEEEKEKKNDLEETRKEEIGTKQKHRKKLKPRERYEDDPRRVSKRVHRLSDFEIRREYGIMAKPFKTLTQNVLYVLFNAGGVAINSNAIAKELGKSLPDVSSVLSGIWKKLKDTGLINREKKGLAYHYLLQQSAHDHGQEWIIKNYFPSQGGQRKKVEPAPVEVDDPRLAGAFNHLKEQTTMLLQRIESLEQDGLEAKVNDALNQMRGLALSLGKVMAFQDDWEDKIQAAIPMDRTPGKFDLNVNVRFLLR